MGPKFILALFCAMPAMADTVVPVRTIRAQSIISVADVVLKTGVVSDGFSQIEDVIGQEARVALYPGRIIGLSDIGPPALVQRNQIVRVIFRTNGLQITAEGRALERGGVGDQVRIMNTSSRATLFGQVQADGSVFVRQ